MEASTRASGGTTRLTVREGSFTLMAIFIRESGSMTKLTVKAHTNTWMDLSMSVPG